MTDTELFEAMTNFEGVFRLSNKSAALAHPSWWCYLLLDKDGMVAPDDVIVQANSPRKALEEAFKKFAEKN